MKNQKSNPAGRLARLLPVMSAAALLTAAVFFLLPALETVSALPSPEYMVREASVTRPPPPELPSPEPIVQEAPQSLPIPVVAPLPSVSQPPRPAGTPALPSLEFILPLDALTGDFALNFPVETAPPVSLPAVNPVFELGDLDQAPATRVALPPLYPPAARLRRQEGEVVVEFVVDAAGLPHDVRALQGTPPGLFEDAATQAVRRWRFDPGRLRGEAVQTRVRQKILFRMDEP